MLSHGSFALLQALPDNQITDLSIVAIGGFLALVLFLGLILLFVTRYKRCPANRVLVISGRVGGDEAARCISGGVCPGARLPSHAGRGRIPTQVEGESTAPASGSASRSPESGATGAA